MRAPIDEVKRSDYNRPQELKKATGGFETPIRLMSKTDLKIPGESSLDGGQFIPYGRQDINQEDIDAVVEVLRSDWLTQGPLLGRFEKAVADYCGAKYAVAVNSGTSALHLACWVLGLGPGDWLWTSPISFVASANCARYCGAGVDFVDIDPQTYNMSVATLESKLAMAERQGRLPKVVTPVHFAGQSCDMKTISQLAERYRFAVIEDACHALGGSYRGRKVGSCLYSDLNVFSFHPVKSITTAEGGIVLTNDQELYDRLCLLRTHGIIRNEGRMTGSSEGPWYYQQIDLGWNFRLNDLQAALGLSQMKRLDEFVSRREELARRYYDLLEDLPVRLPGRQPDSESAWHLYVVRLELDSIGKGRRQVFESLREAGIGVNVHYIPIHLQPYYQALGFRTGQFPEAERYYAEALTLPLYFRLTESGQERVVKALRESIQ
jgi:UDP-4-amino-4,6-dideoxy-N-acetyl-beta-L-altrosamine transaminase